MSAHPPTRDAATLAPVLVRERKLERPAPHFKGPSPVFFWRNAGILVKRERRRQTPFWEEQRTSLHTPLAAFMEHYDSVDDFLACAPRWQEEMTEVRGLLKKCGLGESIKWGKPCFTHGDHNIAILQPMKSFLSLMFFKGALLDDPKGLLEEQGQNTRSARRIRFFNTDQVTKVQRALRALVHSAVAVEEEGKELPPAPKPTLVEELRTELARDRKFRAAFEGLSPGRQREYDLHISSAKQAKTRAARVEKHRSRILAGKGLRDR